MQYFCFRLVYDIPTRVRLVHPYIKFKFVYFLLKCSRDDVADKLCKKIEDIPAVHIANPKTLEFQVCFCLQSNPYSLHHPFPLSHQHAAYRVVYFFYKFCTVKKQMILLKICSVYGIKYHSLRYPEMNAESLLMFCVGSQSLLCSFPRVKIICCWTFYIVELTSKLSEKDEIKCMCEKFISQLVEVPTSSSPF